MRHRHRWLIGALVVGLAVALALTVAGGQGALAADSTIYVDADATSGANDGSSWDDAYIDLQDALAEAEAEDQIWVAAGTYKPTAEHGGTGDRYRSFQLMNGVTLYGGFDPDAGDTEWKDRDWEANPTILSGDIGTEGDSSDNSYHVFYHPDGTNLDSSAILDGFTITGGNANGIDSPPYAGGGMYNSSSSPTLTNSTFEGNSAYGGGGGMANVDGSSPTLTNCAFEGNSAAWGGGMINGISSSPTLIDCTFEGNTAGDGGGMYNDDNSSPALANCTFSGNSAPFGSGAGIYNNSSSPALTDCTFEGNSADYAGGGIHNTNGSSPVLINCTFSGNSAPFGDGGGMVNTNGSSPTLTDCSFEGNSAFSHGGGMHNSSSSPVLNNCTFSDNWVDYDGSGGGMYNDGSSPTLTGCTFESNSAGSGGGGGMYNSNGSSPLLTNCTFAGNSAAYFDTAMGGGMYNDASSPDLTNCSFASNSADDSGGGMYNASASSPALTNCILWDNTPDQVSNSSSSPVVTYSDVEGGYPGETNINENPLFVDPDNGDYHLGPDSPCIDVGDNDAPNLPLYDFEGDIRILDGDGDGTATVDMGVDEVSETTPPPAVIFVDLDASGENDGTSWEDALTDLQDALAWAVDGVQIWVAAGTYKPTSGTDRTASFQMVNGAAIYGGFAGTETSLEQRDWTANPTILSGDIGTEGNANDNVYHVFYHPDGTALDGSAILDGFTITGGNANGGTWPHANVGGGMVNIGSSPTLTDCTFEGNLAVYSGGGMYNNYYSSPTLTDCTFAGNSAGQGGGGMYNNASSPTLTNCTFSNNSTLDVGGGMANWSSSPTLTNCTFSNNSALDVGGGMYNYQHSSPTVTDCTFSSNSASNGGGMYNNWSSSPELINCTFSGNSAGYDGGGMYNLDSSPTLTNCTFSGNSTDFGGGGMYNYESSPMLTNCTFSANSAGNGGGMYNYESSPMLTNCTFSANSANWGGGVINDHGSSPTLTNCTFTDNSAGAGGGMFNYVASSPTLTNCTFSGNSTDYGGGGIYNSEGSSPVLTDCILWGDTTNEIQNEQESSPIVTYSDVQGGYEGTGNIDEDPLFADPTNGDYHLRSGSPCIDTGNNEAPNLPLYDFEGDERIMDGNGDGTTIVDMGIDEAFWRLVYLPVVLRGY